MPCYHPLKAWHIGYHDSGKDKYKITSHTTDYVKGALSEPITIPCGRCVGCRLEYSREWADRCMLEMKYHDVSWFCTFTYSDEFLPINMYPDEDGVCVESATLDKRDFQLFMKRLRKNYKYDNHLKYFVAGEYGDITFRPHYHAILFGLKLDDLVLWKKSQDGFNLYRSAWLESIWKKGEVYIAEASWDTCAYTARYIMKKQYGSAAQIYDMYNIQPEFTLMSRKPAIGKEYFEDNKDLIFDSDCIFVGTDRGSHKIRPPKYYERLFEVEDSVKYGIMKERNKKIAEDLAVLKKERTSLPYLEMLQVEENNKIAKLHALPRKVF